MGIPALSPADSARVAAQVYTVSLLSVVPFVAAGLAALMARRATAGTRVLVWRAAVVAVLLVAAMRAFAGLIPAARVSLPATLASPLVALGRVQVGAPAGAPTDTLLLQLLVTAYLAGALVVLLGIVRGWWATQALARAAHPVIDSEWTTLLGETRAAMRVRRRVRLLVSDDQRVPVTWGTLHPTILLPRHVEQWAPTHRRAVLLHELAHVRAADACMLLLARLVCALLWFLPAPWWIARRLRAECELASDDRVLAAGVPRSDYAELLAAAAAALRPAGAARSTALAISERAGLRARIAAVVDARRDLRAPARTRTLLAAGLTLAVALPTGSTQLAPTRELLTTLMRDARWESRAWAVVRLAQRPDSVAVAREAATRDPSPRVRAYAASALARR